MNVQRALKRGIDIIVSTAGLVILSPVLLGVGLAVWICHGRPILFRQSRPGLGGKPFVIYKFRTMVESRDDSGAMLSDGQRLTKLGRILRATSLDELPELYNVLLGEMSLVGPRPLLTEYVDRYTSVQARRHGMKPGMTGWAQINGRNGTTWEQRFALDLWYVENWSLTVDLDILLRTPWTVVRRAGISAPGHPTMPEFTGPKAGNGQQR